MFLFCFISRPRRHGRRLRRRELRPLSAPAPAASPAAAPPAAAPPAAARLVAPRGWAAWCGRRADRRRRGPRPLSPRTTGACDDRSDSDSDSDSSSILVSHPTRHRRGRLYRGRRRRGPEGMFGGARTPPTGSTTRTTRTTTPRRLQNIIETPPRPLALLARHTPHSWYRPPSTGSLGPFDRPTTASPRSFPRIPFRSLRLLLS